MRGLPGRWESLWSPGNSWEFPGVSQESSGVHKEHVGEGKDLVADGETDVVEAKAVQSDQKPSKAASGAAYVKLIFFPSYYLTNSDSQSMIKIEKNFESSSRSSMTASCNGDKKWKHSHLPDQAQTESLFKNVVVSRARMKTASLEPWALLSVKDLQLIVDEVFPEKRLTLIVIIFSINNVIRRSRNSSPGTTDLEPGMGLKAVESHIDANRKGLPTKELVAGEISAHLVKAPIMITPEHTYYTYYYQWSEWSEDPALRKGLGRNQLILYTFANAHLVHLNDIDSLVNSRPIGALLLSMQAVERALEYWKEGERAKKDLPEFSKNNFGDTFTKAEKNAKRIRRATIFVKTLERLTDAEWTSLIEEAREWLDDNRRARATSASPNTTHIRKCSAGFCHGSLMPNGHSSHPAACSVAEFTNETIVSSSFACNPRSAVYSLQGCFIISNRSNLLDCVMYYMIQRVDAVASAWEIFQGTSTDVVAFLAMWLIVSNQFPSSRLLNAPHAHPLDSAPVQAWVFDKRARSEEPHKAE
ncbi:hypothetical protein F5887DRAFT_1281381 [Amanita rubescens]|nr:hypothetical protein F5887DRAFT_1281381 [Amanita rubescens]